MSSTPIQYNKVTAYRSLVRRVTGPKGHGSEWSLVPNLNPNPNSNSNGLRSHNDNVTIRTSDPSH